MVFDDVKKGDMFLDIQRGSYLTVKEVTEKGFNYTCTPYNALPARYGPSLVTNGELWYKLHVNVDWDKMYRKWRRSYEQWDWIEGTWTRAS